MCQDLGFWLFACSPLMICALSRILCLLATTTYSMGFPSHISLCHLLLLLKVHWPGPGICFFSYVGVRMSKDLLPFGLNFMEPPFTNFDSKTLFCPLSIEDGSSYAPGPGIFVLRFSYILFQSNTGIRFS